MVVSILQKQYALYIELYRILHFKWYTNREITTTTDIMKF